MDVGHTGPAPQACPGGGDLPQPLAGTQRHPLPGLSLQIVHDVLVSISSSLIFAGLPPPASCSRRCPAAVLPQCAGACPVQL